MFVSKIWKNRGVQNILRNGFRPRNFATSSEGAEIEYLKRRGNSLAYISTPASRNDDSPGIVFCPGFQSNMQGVKATAIESYCINKGLAYVRFDYEGCGHSEGDIREVTFSDWKKNVIEIIDSVTAGPQILVGSSMGAWLMLHAALERPHRIHSLVGISSAPDFAQRAFKNFSEESKKDLSTLGETIITSEWGNYVITSKFLEDITQHNLLNRQTIPVHCPVRFLHGMCDTYVPYKNALQLAEKLSSHDVLLLLRKRGDHRMSQPEDIHMLFTELDYLIEGTEDSKKLAISSWAAFSLWSEPEKMITTKKLINHK